MATEAFEALTPKLDAQRSTAEKSRYTQFDASLELDGLADKPSSEEAEINYRFLLLACLVLGTSSAARVRWRAPRRTSRACALPCARLPLAGAQVRRASFLGTTLE